MWGSEYVRKESFQKKKRRKEKEERETLWRSGRMGDLIGVGGFCEAG